MYKKLVIVTRKTRLQELIARFNTRSQAKFYIEHAGGDFSDYEREDQSYARALELLRQTLEFAIPQQMVDRSLVPTFQFQKEDLVVTLGQDGLVANTAKYVGAQPIVAVNPEPDRFDGILLPFLPDGARAAVDPHGGARPTPGRDSPGSRSRTRRARSRVSAAPSACRGPARLRAGRRRWAAAFSTPALRSHSP